MPFLFSVQLLFCYAKDFFSSFSSLTTCVNPLHLISSSKTASWGWCPVPWFWQPKHWQLFQFRHTLLSEMHLKLFFFNFKDCSLLQEQLSEMSQFEITEIPTNRRIQNTIFRTILWLYAHCWSHYSNITDRHCITHSRLQHFPTWELQGIFLRLPLV